MKYFSFIKKLIIVPIVYIFCGATVYAAQLIIDAPSQLLANRQPVVVRVFLTTDGVPVSGLFANFSYPKDMFTVTNISVENSIIPLFINQPSVSAEKYFDGREHISFEGIFPGGYSGVRSPYYSGERPGIIFAVTLIPKRSGDATFMIDDIALHAFDSKASDIYVPSVTKFVHVPELTGNEAGMPQVVRNIKNQSVTAFINRDPLIESNAWHLVVTDTGSKSSVQKIVIAETDDYNGELVKDNLWRNAVSPYVLLYQDRTKFVHVKVLYANNSYSLLTLPPVENSQSISTISRILVSILAVLSLLYFYGKQIFFHNKKNN